jgi:hypothetical protein
MKRTGMTWLTDGNGDPYEALVMAILYTAANDAKSGDPGARLWLASEDCRHWCELLDITPEFRARLRGIAGQSPLQLSLGLAA